VLARVTVGYGGDEAIALARDGFDVARALGVVGQSVADLLDAEIDSGFEVDISIVAPEAALDFFTGDELPGAFGEQLENTDRLGMNFEGESGFAQFAAGGVQFERAEA